MIVDGRGRGKEKEREEGERLFWEGFLEVVEGDGGDFFEAFGREFVEGIVGGVPREVIEVDEIDGGDAGDDLEWDVVIEDLA